MKKIILTVAVFLFLISCSKSPEIIAQKNISEYVKNLMNDPKSYESVKFGKLDTIYQNFSETDEGIKLASEDSDLSNKMKALTDEIASANSSKELIKIRDKNEYITKRRYEIADINEKNIHFKGKFKGLFMIHQYRSKNSFGALILKHNRFILDKNLNVKDLQYF